MRPREEENVERILDHFGGLEKLVERIQNIIADPNEWSIDICNHDIAVVEILGDTRDDGYMTMNVCNKLGLKIPEHHVKPDKGGVILTDAGWRDIEDAFSRVSDIVEEALADIGLYVGVFFELDWQDENYFELLIMRQYNYDDDGDRQEEVMG